MTLRANVTLALILFLILTFLILIVESRSFQTKTNEGSKETPLTTVHETNDREDSPGDKSRSNVNNLVNILDNKFTSVEDNQEKYPHTLNTGDDSTSPLSSEEQEMIKKRILDGLGLTTIPTRNLSNIPEEEIEMAYREYEKAIEEEERRHREQLEEEEEEDYDEEEEEEEEEGGDSSPSYRFYGTKIDRRWSGRSRRSSNNGQQIVHFYVSLPLAIDSNSSRVVEATSRFWKRGVSSQNNNASLSSTTIPVSFYRLDDIPRGKFRYTKLDPIFITTKNVSIYGNEWVELDMINAIRAWMNSPKSDTGILIKCPDCDAAGVKFLTGSHRKGPEGTTKVPRLDVRTEIVGLRRVKRSRKMRKSLKKNIRHHADCHDATHPRGKRSNRCCRRSMQVRFADLPRFDFILSPKEFDAYYCSGKCPARYNPANEHALLQSLLNLRGKNNVPGPCCAPTKLKGLNILHIGDDGRIKTTFWRDVIVTECGCA